MVWESLRKDFNPLLGSEVDSLRIRISAHHLNARPDQGDGWPPQALGMLEFIHDPWVRSATVKGGRLRASSLSSKQ